MSKRISKILIIVMAVFTLSAMSCPPHRPARVFRYADGWRFDYVHGGIVIVSVIDAVGAANEDGVIVIPTELNGYNVVRLGDPGDYYGWWDDFRFFSDSNARVNRIVIPQGIHVDNTFWHSLYITDYVEFLGEEPAVSRLRGFDGGRITIIVPDGSADKYRKALGVDITHTVIVERSAVWRYTEINEDEIRLESVLDLAEAVDEDGVLTIPYEINGQTVSELGSIFPAGHTDVNRDWSNRYFYRGLRRINLIVIPEDIYVLEGFWRGLELTDYVEFLDETPVFNSLGRYFDRTRISIYVPHGRREAYIERLGRPGWIINMFERPKEDSANGNG